MSYYIAQPYKCLKCGFDFKYTPDDPHPSPVLKEEHDSFPTCPKCWNKFLRKHIGLGYCTVAWTKDGSEYENKLKELGYYDDEY